MQTTSRIILHEILKDFPFSYSNKQIALDELIEAFLSNKGSHRLEGNATSFNL
jgi:hypothetical protein